MQNFPSHRFGLFKGTYSKSIGSLDFNNGIDFSFESVQKIEFPWHSQAGSNPVTPVKNIFEVFLNGAVSDQKYFI